MKDRDQMTRDADVTLWSDGKPISEVLGMEKPTEETLVEEKLTKTSMTLGFTIALFSGVVLGAFIYAVSIGIVGLMQMLGGKR